MNTQNKTSKYELFSEQGRVVRTAFFTDFSHERVKGRKLARKYLEKQLSGWEKNAPHVNGHMTIREV